MKAHLHLRSLFVPWAMVVGILGGPTQMSTQAFAASAPSYIAIRQGLQLVLKGSGNQSMISAVVPLPSASAIATLLKHDHLTGSQRQELLRVPTEIVFHMRQTTNSNGDPVDDAYVCGYDAYGDHEWTFEANQGYSSSGGVITGVAGPNFYGTQGSEWWTVGSTTYNYPYDPIGATEFQANFYGTFNNPTFNQTDQAAMDVTYQADGTYQYAIYLNGTYQYTTGPWPAGYFNGQSDLCQENVTD